MRAFVLVLSFFIISQSALAGLARADIEERSFVDTDGRTCVRIAEPSTDPWAILVGNGKCELLRAAEINKVFVNRIYVERTREGVDGKPGTILVLETVEVRIWIAIENRVNIMYFRLSGDGTWPESISFDNTILGAVPGK